jgi:ubiquitin carboxyl-terminal hydrolase 36/42
MQETCTWLTRELTRITKDYTKQETSQKSGFLTFLGAATHKPVVDPGSITRNPHRLSSCLRPYQQEDAHEFLRALLSTLVMNGHNKELSSLFDGLLESAVTFQSCGHTSLTRDRYMDLSLDISHDYIKTLPDALEEFTKTEVLDCDNKVLCDKCGEKQQVSKGLRLATAPSILVCHLKRFAIDRYGRPRRLSKHVQFPLRLEIGDYMSRMNKATPPPYELVGVLVHQGRSCASGHYLAYVKSGNDWFKTNDNVITKVDISTVMSQQAYILLYEVAEMRAKHNVSKMIRNPQERPLTPETIASWDPASSFEEEEMQDKSSANFMSVLCMQAQAVNAFVNGELCCGPVVPPSCNDEEVTIADSTSSTSPETRRRKDRYRSKRSASSSNLKELEHEVTGIPPRLPVQRARTATRNNFFSNHSDPGGNFAPIRSNSARKYHASNSPGKDKPPRPSSNHKRRHSHAPPRSPR